MDSFKPLNTPNSPCLDDGLASRKSRSQCNPLQKRADVALGFLALFGSLLGIARVVGRLLLVNKEDRSPGKGRVCGPLLRSSRCYVFMFGKPNCWELPCCVLQTDPTSSNILRTKWGVPSGKNATGFRCPIALRSESHQTCENRAGRRGLGVCNSWVTRMGVS